MFYRQSKHRTEHHTVHSAANVLSISDLDKLVSHCARYYGETECQTAMNHLKQWYIDQEFDDIDFADDWVPNDFDNCDGIDIFMEKLNVGPGINNEHNKRVVFDWFCYWLFPNIDEPKIKT